MALKILLADDSMTAQNLGKKILTDAGYEVVTVSNGAAAARKIAEVKPQVCILDIYMPGYTGLEVCARVKNAPQTSRIPVLLTVGKMEPYKPEEGARVRADGVIVKPFEATELLRAVQRFANRSHGPAARSAAPPLGPATSVEKTVRLTREQIQEMMDPDSQHWRENAVTPQPLQVPAEMASTPRFDVDDVLAPLQSSAQPSSAPPVDADMPAFLAAIAAEPEAKPQEAAESAVVASPVATSTIIAEPQEVSADAPSVSAVLPGFVDYVAAVGVALPHDGETVTASAGKSNGNATAVWQAVEDDGGTAVAVAELEPRKEPEPVAVAPEPAKTEELSKSPAEQAPAVAPSVDDTQKIDPEILAAARRASLAAEISLRMEEEPASPALASADGPGVTEMKPVDAVAPAAEVPTAEKPIEATEPAKTEVVAEAAPLIEPPASKIPDADVNLETMPPVGIHAVQDPNLQVPVSDKAEIVTESGLEPTSVSAEASGAPVTRDPALTAYGAAPEQAAPATPPVSEELPVASVAEESPSAEPSTLELANSTAKPVVTRPEDVPEEIAAALDSLGGLSDAPANATSIAHGGQRYWVAEEVAVSEAESTVSLLEEMQSSRSIREQKPAEVTPIEPEVTVRDDQNSPESAGLPGAGGTARSTRDVAPASELAAAMAAAFGGALPSSELARAEATQPISEEVRRFALGDTYKPKPKAGFGGASIEDPTEMPMADSISDLRLAKAVSRAIDRLKPQLVAEILKELKSLEE